MRSCAECRVEFKPRRTSSKYCSRQCAWANNGSSPSEQTWWVNSRGYVEGRVLTDEGQVRVKKHRWIVERHLRRKLRTDEDVHHVNGDKQDNRIENLEVVLHGAHTVRHCTGQIRNPNGRTNIVRGAGGKFARAALQKAGLL